MEKITCKYCINSAVYTCSCATPKINYCRDHQEEHESEFGNHNITLIYPRFAAPVHKSKQKLIERISQIKAETKNQVQLIIQKVNACITELKEKIKNMIKLSSQFTNLCDSIITEILSINAIYIKKIYSPLEALLLSENNESIFSMIKGPKITFSEDSKNIKYVPSEFPHFLYNYSDHSIEFSLRNTLNVYPSNKIMQFDAIDWSSRFLNVGNNKILLTGGQFALTDSILLDLNNEEIIKLPNLINKRYWHAMT